MKDKLNREQRIERDKTIIQKIKKGDERELSKLIENLKNKFVIKNTKKDLLCALGFRDSIKISIEEAFYTAAEKLWKVIKKDSFELTGEIEHLFKTILECRLSDQYKLEKDKNFWGVNLDIETASNIAQTNEATSEAIEAVFIVNEYINKIKEPCNIILNLIWIDGFKASETYTLMPDNIKSRYNNFTSYLNKTKECQDNNVVILEKILNSRGFDILNI